MTLSQISRPVCEIVISTLFTLNSWSERVRLRLSPFSLRRSLANPWLCNWRTRSEVKSQARADRFERFLFVRPDSKMGGQDDLFAFGEQEPGGQQPVQFLRLVLILLAKSRVSGLFIFNEIFQGTVFFSVRRMERERDRRWRPKDR